MGSQPEATLLLQYNLRGNKGLLVTPARWALQFLGMTGMKPHFPNPHQFSRYDEV